MRNAYDVEKVGVVYIRAKEQHVGLSTKLLDMQKYYKRAKTVLNVVRCDSKIGVYCERCELYCGKDWFLWS